MSRDVEPFMFEPEYSDTDEAENNFSEQNDSDNDSQVENQADRLGHNDWCECGHCQSMLTAPESVCCRERDRVLQKLNDMAVESNCIARTERFQSLCLDGDVLRISLLLIHNALRKGPVPTPTPNRYSELK